MKENVGRGSNDINDFRSIVESMCGIYELKNAAYGNSFSQLYQEFGKLAAVVPLSNKLNRIKELIKNPSLQANNENLRDSIIDLANYAVMFAIELDKE